MIGPVIGPVIGAVIGRALRLAMALSCLAVPGAAMAQAYQCSAPATIGPLPRIEPDGPPVRTAIGGYVLAASWSPEYCRKGNTAASMQCSGANGRFGFVLHGLWPEAASGPSPQWCAALPMPSPALVRRNLCMTPVPWLLAHEWAKHGTCMAKRPEDYYAVSARLWRRLAWPDADRLSRKPDLTAGDLRAAFVEANLDWRPEQVGILASNTGWLREIQICMDRKFRPRPCPARMFGPPGAATLKIWRGL